MAWRQNVPLSEWTTLAVGGPARFYAEVDSTEALGSALEEARSRSLPVFVLGGGSNVLVSDAGFEGLVLRYSADHVHRGPGEGGTVRLRVGAGKVWDDLVAYTVDEGLAGIACLSGIPGRVGAAPIQNIGAYGQEIAERVDAVIAVDRQTGTEHQFTAEACGFGYRQSLFKGAWRGRYVVTEVWLRLRPGGESPLRYAELQRRFGGRETAPLGDVRETVLSIRRSKSMVYDPADPNHRSAGSFFVNPVVSASDADAVVQKARALFGPDAEPPRYPAPDGGVKLPAAWLIERSGFSKGFERGQAGLSSKHCLALINRGGASADALLALAAEIRDGVRETFGVSLTPEPVMLGFSDQQMRRVGV